jgi:hypothetical protein
MLPVKSTAARRNQPGDWAMTRDVFQKPLRHSIAPQEAAGHLRPANRGVQRPDGELTSVQATQRGDLPTVVGFLIAEQVRRGIEMPSVERQESTRAPLATQAWDDRQLPQAYGALPAVGK